MKITLATIIIIVTYSINCVAQFGEDYMKYRFRNPFQGESLYKSNGIKKIYGLHFLKSDLNKPYLINEYELNQDGYLVKILQSDTNIEWQCCDSFKYKTAEKYDYKYSDSILLEITFNIRNFVDSTIGVFKPDTLKPSKRVININRILKYSSKNLTCKYDFDKNNLIQKITKLYHSIKTDSTTIDFLYDSHGHLISFVEKQARVFITSYLEDKTVDFFYDDIGQLFTIEEHVQGKPLFSIKYYYNKKQLLIKREEYFDNKLTIVDKFIYN